MMDQPTNLAESVVSISFIFCVHYSWLVCIQCVQEVCKQNSLQDCTFDCVFVYWDIYICLYCVVLSKLKICVLIKVRYYL